jgi:hypothetical protein
MLVYRRALLIVSMSSLTFPAASPHALDRSLLGNIHHGSMCTQSVNSDGVKPTLPVVIDTFRIAADMLLS